MIVTQYFGYSAVDSSGPRTLGLAIFILAFFEPAVRAGQNHSAIGLEIRASHCRRSMDDPVREAGFRPAPVY